MKKRVLLFLMLLSIIPSWTATGASKRPVARQGVLDLTSWDFSRDGPVDLDGEWGFYWNHLQTPEEIQSGRLPIRTGLVELPGVWNDISVNGRSIGGTGFHQTNGLQCFDG